MQFLDFMDTKFSDVRMLIETGPVLLGLLFFVCLFWAYKQWKAI